VLGVLTEAEIYLVLASDEIARTRFMLTGAALATPESRKYALDLPGSVSVGLEALIGARRAVDYARAIAHVEVAVERQRSKQAQRAANARNAGWHELKAVALAEYSAGAWKSRYAAAPVIFARLVPLAERHGLRFSQERGVRTVYGWLLAAAKEREDS
jgi:hypothetical protein